MPKRLFPFSPEEAAEVGSRFDCPRCGGRGYLSYDVPVSDPNFGKAFPCDAPGCTKEQFEQTRRSPEALRKKGIDKPLQTFDLFKQVKGVKAAFESARALGDGTADFFFLLIYGGAGNGKTYLCNATASLLNHRSIDCRIYNVQDMFAFLRSGIASNEFDERKEAIKGCMGLVLDDYKPEFSTPAQQDWMEEIIEYRDRHYLLTLLTTNRDVAELPERIVSRFYDLKVGRVVKNEGADYRRRRQ